MQFLMYANEKGPKAKRGKIFLFIKENSEVISQHRPS